MKFFQIKSDSAWELAHGVECLARSTWEMPAMQCPAQCRLLPTRVPGYCYPAADFAFDLFLWRALERWGIPKPVEELQWQAQWRDSEKWLQLQDRVLSALPYSVPITPGTCFGVSQVRITGRAADWYWDLEAGHVFIAGQTLNQLQKAGLVDLFAVPCIVKPSRSRVYFELQIEHSAELNGELRVEPRLISESVSRRFNCKVCGRQTGVLPKHPVLKGSTIPAGASLFRLKQSPTSVFCSEAFRDAAVQLELANMVFLEVATDGSEKRQGFARVTPARPAQWVPREGFAGIGSPRLYEHAQSA
jgi:hypothetical protein